MTQPTPTKSKAPTSLLGGMFTLKACRAYPGLKANATIPDHLKSAHASAKASRLGLGAAQAFATLLQGSVRWSRLASSFSVEYTGNSGQPHVIVRSANANNPQIRTWKNAGGHQAVAMFVMFEAHAMGLHDEVKAAMTRALQVHEQVLGKKAFYTEAELQRAAQGTAVLDALTHLGDAIYFAAKRAEGSGATLDDHPLGAPQPAHLGQVMMADKIVGAQAAAPANPQGPAVTPTAGVSKPPRPPRAQAAVTPATPLERIVALKGVGGRALMVGPTGTFKTETAKRAAIAMQAKLVSMKGRPGVEDREFFGGVFPGDQGPRWVDGPLTRAFRLAQTHPTCLIIDEVLRYDPLYLNAFVGAMDRVVPDELRALDLPVPGGAAERDQFYVLELPNGERMAAPERNLIWLATTNIGDDYVQFGRVDAALLGRFNLQLEFRYPDDVTLLGIYGSAAQGNQALASAALAVEKWTRDPSARSSGLVSMASHVRISVGLIEETLRAQARGMPLRQAFGDAAEVTLIPYCVPRTPQGDLDGRALSAVRQAIEMKANAERL